jgi:competence protein ComFC
MLGNIFNFLLNSFFPKKKTVLDIENLAKENKLRTLSTAPETPYTFIRSIFQYKDPKVRNLVWEIKYALNPILTDAIAQIMSEEIMSFFEERGHFISKDWIIVPIPSSKKHEKERGFNQTKELCLKIIKYLPENTLTYEPNAIIKTKETTPQAKIRNRNQRLKNLRGVFNTIKNINLSNKNVILVDDVVTTGSTLIEARRALKEAGVKRVIAITIAH